MDKHIYDKTDKGREEIATRKYHLPAKLRALLVMMDGHRPLEALTKNFGAMGLSSDNVLELLKDEFIVLVDDGVPELAPEQAALHRPGMSARARQTARLHASTAGRPHHGDEGPATAIYEETDDAPVTPAPLPAAQPDDGMSDSERHMAVQAFYTQTIKSTLGLRGMMLQLKVEKCSGIEDFRELRDVYVEAVLKAKGSEMALSLSRRLDQLLGTRADQAL